MKKAPHIENLNKIPFELIKKHAILFLKFKESEYMMSLIKWHIKFEKSMLSAKRYEFHYLNNEKCLF
jgi:hypothetical protein